MLKDTKTLTKKLRKITIFCLFTHLHEL